MTKNIFFMVTLEIKPEKQEAFRTLVTEMGKATQVNEPGTLNYEFFMGEEPSICHVYERFADSEAFLKHLEIFSKHFAARLEEVCDIAQIKVYGNPNKEAKEKLIGPRRTFMSPIAGFLR